MESTQKQSYTQPEITVLGSVADLTQDYTISFIVN